VLLPFIILGGCLVRGVVQLSVADDLSIVCCSLTLVGSQWYWCIKPILTAKALLTCLCGHLQLLEQLVAAHCSEPQVVLGSFWSGQPVSLFRHCEAYWGLVYQFLYH